MPCRLNSQRIKGLELEPEELPQTRLQQKPYGRVCIFLLFRLSEQSGSAKSRNSKIHFWRRREKLDTRGRSPIET